MPWERLADVFPHPLTDEQRHGIALLVDKLNQPQASLSLINGDVGTGKTVVFLVPVAYCVQAGKRAAILLPHGRLAAQAYREFRELWPHFPVKLVAGDKGNDEDLSDVPLLIGTTALLHRPVGQFDLVVVDEQQRFAAQQRAALTAGGAHLIEVSATPIPRSMALAVYGALDVIPITQRHSPQQIRSHIIMPPDVPPMLSKVRELLEQGCRILVVCPKRQGDDVEVLSSVRRVADRWEALFPGRVRRAESSMEDAVIAEAIEDIMLGRAQILVSTTVVETGLNLPDLRGVIVVNAERFGVSQLHQIRGRLAREGGDGWFWAYLPKPVNPKTMSRLEAVVSTCDGFELSRLDMAIRGVGDLSMAGKKQHGAADTLLYNRAVPIELMDEMIQKLYPPVDELPG
jgi:ATP-dependent DNA helicase RecG